jgi:hypothetical protein
MKTLALVLGLAALAGLNACAAGHATGAAKPADAAPAKAAAAVPSPDKAPMLVGTDILTPLPVAKIWAVLSAIDNWGVWNPKITKVQAGPGLNAGTAVTYGWEEREIQAVIEDVKEDERLVWKGARTGKDVLMRWELRPAGQNVVVSLRAVLRPGANATTVANAGLETQAWMGALQVELTRLVDSLPKPAAKKKKAAK